MAVRRSATLTCPKCNVTASFPYYTSHYSAWRSYESDRMSEIQKQFPKAGPFKLPKPPKGWRRPVFQGPKRPVQHSAHPLKSDDWTVTQQGQGASLIRHIHCTACGAQNIATLEKIIGDPVGSTQFRPLKRRPKQVKRSW